MRTTTARHGLRRFATFGILALVAMAGGQLWADVRLAAIFGNSMVLQRDVAVPVWGWADAGEEVSVQVDEQAAVTATTGNDGKWRVQLPAMPAGGPHKLTVKGKNEITLEDVLVGEVWLCSGQSNMQWVVRNSLNPAEEAAAANYPQIRQYTVPNVPAPLPKDDVKAAWMVCSPQTAPNFTACGYFMGRDLYKELNIPIGLLNSSWGGTRIEPWTPPEGFAAVPALEGIYKQVRLRDPRTPEFKQALQEYLGTVDGWTQKAKETMAAEAILDPCPAYPGELQSPTLSTTPQQQPCTLYYGMISHFVGFPIRGAIWYQGESNHGEGMLYTEKTKALVNGWRQLWGIGDFPFFYVQIAPYMYGNEDPFVMARFWEAQNAALEIPNTGMVVTTDIGDVNNIHPKNKQEVGRRLCLLAMAKCYGKTDLVCSGPTFKAMAIEGDKLRVTFDSVGKGLASRDGKPLTWFEISGEDTGFVTADAAIDGASVLLSSAKVPKPLAMRFCWHKTAEPNLMNSEGLPASAFRAGEVPVRDFLVADVGESKEYQLVYTLDLAKLGPNPAYDVDRRAELIMPFDRVAYFLELQKTDGDPVQYVYVSMDAFTTELSKIGVPTVASGAFFQTRVKNMSVISNVQGIATGSGLNGGVIEFWPNNYGPPNAGGVPNASNDVYDFGDQPSDPKDGYGSMQVGNFEAKQTIFAVNNWKNGGDIGIGNSEGKTRDWTFTGSAGSYATKKLRVLVHPKK